MNLLLLTFTAGLLTPALSLTCHVCDKDTPSCSESFDQCPSDGHRCASWSTTTSVPLTGQDLEVYLQGCVLPDQCSSMSYTDGKTRHVVNVECCNTDRCNSQAVTGRSVNNNNGRHCYYCNDNTCKATLNCTGSEDHCFTNTVYDGGVAAVSRGCASKQVCDSSQSAKGLLELTGSIHCCQGDLCNGALGSGTSLVLLAAPLLSAALL
ncbi:urokinase plasminogen activator surface receptor-like [Synchiropus splendidus]|uniref:urokinase plasminogen activator surface receptor-like n=1 Tax=Synchiropus splendidus TaxID=270530 RepID=UPI00237E185A|nr:urokinase plasminogen activator surface receptor-like [Synchiropus splendidus]